jgi:hypothetical protein
MTEPVSGSVTEPGPRAGLSARVAGWLFRPVDGAGLAAFRILFGLVMFGALVRLMTTGWIRPLFVEPRFFFKYPGFSWVPGGSEPGMYLHVTVLAVLALCIASGLFYRVSAALFAVGFAWLELIDATNYLNHYYLVVLLSGVMAFLPLHRTWSLDAWRRPELAREPMPAWALYLVRVQVGLVYFNAGLAKFGTDWLLHAQPLSIWMSARTEVPVIGPWLDEPWTAYAMSWAGFLFDLTIVLWLSLSRTRPFAYAVVCLFHFFTSVFFNIGIFPVLMVVNALIFFPPHWPRRLLRRPPVSLGTPRSVAFSGARRVGLTVAVAWCLFHTLVPLRHLLYPGDVIWNEEGMRWSWKVMLREKSGSVTFRVRDPASGREWQVSPAQYLNPRQRNEMAGQPDLILQLARHIGRQFEQQRGVAGAEVRVDAWVSLNGRAPARLIHPDVDLMRVEYGLARATWILPEPQEPPLDPFAARGAMRAQR